MHLAWDSSEIWPGLAFAMCHSCLVPSCPNETVLLLPLSNPVCTASAWIPLLNGPNLFFFCFWHSLVHWSEASEIFEISGNGGLDQWKYILSRFTFWDVGKDLVLILLAPFLFSTFSQIACSLSGYSFWLLEILQIILRNCNYNDVIDDGKVNTFRMKWRQMKTFEHSWRLLGFHMICFHRDFFCCTLLI